MKLVIEVSVEEFDTLGSCLQQMQEIVAGVSKRNPPSGSLSRLLQHYENDRFVILSESVVNNTPRVVARMVATRAPFDATAYGAKQAETYGQTMSADED